MADERRARRIGGTDKARKLPAMNLRLRPAPRERLEELARRSGRTKTAVIEDAIMALPLLPTTGGTRG